MSNPLIVLCTCEQKLQAGQISEALVQERLAACVNVVPGVQSVYRWKGEIERAEEVLLLIKTTAERFSRLTERIHQLHSYTVPEIIALPIVNGSETYLAWLEGEVNGEKNA